MTSPGGVEVGRVSVRVVPDTSRFARQLKKDLREIAKTSKIQVLVELDLGKISEEMKRAQQKASGEKAKLGVEVDGDGVVRETRRMRQLAQKLVGAIKMTVGLNIPASAARIKADMAIIQKIVQGYNIRIPMEVVGVTKWLGILGAVSAILLTFPHLIGAIGGAVNYVGGALALLPALTAAAAFGIGALVVGMQGFFSALSQAGDAKAFEEALKGLTPAAQESARALAEFREPLSEIRKSVQEQLFKGMADPLRDLKSLLPPIKAGLTGSAAGIREMVKAWIAMATSQKSIDDAGIIARNSSKMFEVMRPALANFAQALKDIAVVGSTFLPRLGKAVSSVTGKFAKWATEARESGRLEQIIENMIDKTKQLGRVIADVVVGFRNIFRAMSGGREFLDMVENITQGFREWSEAEDTQATMRRLANVMRVVAQAAKDVFGAAFKAVGKILKDLEPFLLTFARTFGAVLVGAIRAITPPLQAMARWLSENREIMVPLVITIIAMVTAFKLAVTAANAVLQLKRSIDALRAASSIIGELTTGVLGNLKRMVKQIATTTSAWLTAAARWVWAWTQIAAQAAVNAAKAAAAWIASAAKSAAFTARYYAIMVAQAIANFARMAAAAVAQAAKMAVAWIAQVIRMVVTTVAQLVVMMAAWVAHWTRMAAVALAQAGRIALAWLIAMGPVGIVIGLIILLVAIIVLNWDKIKQATAAAWDWVWGHIKRIWGEITSSFQAGVDFIRGIWDACWKFVSDVITWIRDFIKGAVDKIGGFLRGIGDFIGDVVGFFEKIKNGIVKWTSQAVDWIKSLPGKLWDGIQAAFGKLVDIGKAIIDGIIQGLKNAASAIFNWMKGLVTDVINSVKSWLGIASPSKVFTQIGEFVAEGLAQGIKNQSGHAADEAAKMADSVVSAFGSPKLEFTSSMAESMPEALKQVENFANQASLAASAEWTAQVTAEDMEPLEDRILAALASGLKVELDGRNVTQSVNARNTANLRRK